MANGKQASAKRLKMAERAKQQKDHHFPSTDDTWLWHRKSNDGFITVPRTMPIIMQGIDSLEKGQPAGHTLMCLWCRSPDHALVTIENPAIFASEAGFTGERAVDTWRRRMKLLVKYEFIQTKAGSAGDMHYVLLLNPNWAFERLRSKIPDSIYSKFADRMMDIGAWGEVEEIRGHIVRWAAEAEAAKKAAELATIFAVHSNAAALSLEPAQLSLMDAPEILAPAEAK